MLIVVVIIGILAAALIPRLQSVQERARDAARKDDIQQI
jgi:type II secretory pathway pseudopilin PulG